MKKWNEKRKLEDRTVSFGKYRGKKYTEVPTDYLEWLVAQGWSNWADRKRWAQQELDRRQKAEFEQNYQGIDASGAN